MKIIGTIAVAILMFALFAPTSDAGWLIYHVPEFKGQIIDIDTKQPIEGAVVVAVYKKATMGLGAGSLSSIISARETLTDKDGNFRIPSYTTLIQPFSWQIPNEVIIYKPGYASLETGTWHFIGETLKEEQEGWWPGFKDLKYRLRGHGIVELPKLKTREERLNASMIGLTGYHAKDLPILYKALNEEGKYLGIPERK